MSNNISYSSGGHGQGGVMAERAGNRSTNIFGITVSGQRDRGEKSETSPTPAQEATFLQVR